VAPDRQTFQDFERSVSFLYVDGPHRALLQRYQTSVKEVEEEITRILNRGASMNFQGERDLTRSTIRKVWSLNLPMTTFVFTTYLKSCEL